jgi:2-polyprenyl-6-methoxyphenol hydroxylase-like FAD-dependent oxidoreductase
MSTAIVIGGGIGGLTAALALAGKGWEVSVLERAPALKPVGSALLISPNALRALETIPGGLVPELHALAAMQGDGGMKDDRGRWLSRNDAGLAAGRYGHPVVAALRSELIEMLASRLPVGVLRLATTVTSVDAEAGSVTLATGEVLGADLVVAADGVRSATRAALFPGHPAAEFLGLTGWQAIVDGRGLATHVGTSWGRGGEFGTIPLADGRTYVFAEQAVRTPMALRSGAEEKAELRRLYGGFHDPIPELLSRLDPDGIIHNDVYAVSTPLPAMHSGRVAMLGDAAHAMAPNLGQGACQAIEDAVTLAFYLGDDDALPTAVAVPDALARYSSARLPRTTLMVRRSELIARLATARNPFAIALRNAFLRGLGLFGPSAALRQSDFVMRWDHPAVTPTAVPHPS